MSTDVVILKGDSCSPLKVILYGLQYTQGG